MDDGSFVQAPDDVEPAELKASGAVPWSSFRDSELRVSRDAAGAWGHACLWDPWRETATRGVARCGLERTGSAALRKNSVPTYTRPPEPVVEFRSS